MSRRDFLGLHYNELVALRLTVVGDVPLTVALGVTMLLNTEVAFKDPVSVGTATGAKIVTVATLG